MMTIEDNNYELWLLRYAEGDLNAEERAAVEAWLASHPEAAEELALYGEAPRLERNEEVYYGAMASHPTRPLWSPWLRYSAAAAVVLLLMLPDMRMGTMDKMAAPALVAENHMEDTLQPAAEVLETMAPARPKATVATAEEVASLERADEIEVAGIKEEPAEMAPIMTDMLIAIEDTPTEDALVETNGLIVFDRSTDWGDLFLAANDAYQEALSEHPLGRLVSRTLPDSRQLEEHVVEPLRHRIDNLKNKRK